MMNWLPGGCFTHPHMTDHLLLVFFLLILLHLASKTPELVPDDQQIKTGTTHVFHLNRRPFASCKKSNQTVTHQHGPILLQASLPFEAVPAPGQDIPSQTSSGQHKQAVLIQTGRRSGGQHSNDQENGENLQVIL